MNPWQDLLVRAERERELAAEGRWEELAERIAERGRVAATMPPPTSEVAPLLDRLAEVQAELTATLTAARAETARELGQLRRGQSAMRGYAAAPAARGGWVDESH
jgi:hypothetical protein